MTEISVPLHSDDQPPAIVAARVLLATFIEDGVRHILLSPGSRSAPLAFAAVDLERAGLITLHTRIDERSAAFTALGLASVVEHDGFAAPAVVITTSGTAVANLHPAILEAQHSRIPLIVLTTDRPAELRGTGANQTTDQVEIFGSAVRYAVDVPAPDDSHIGTAAGIPYWRGVASRAYAAAVGADGCPPGPAHLNLCYREPLVPKMNPGYDWTTGIRERASGSKDSSFGFGTTQTKLIRTAVATELERGPRTVIVAGDRAGSAAMELASASGWPLLAEPSSGARSADSITCYRLLLDHEELGGEVERVVLFGHPTLSRPITKLIGRAGLELIVITDDSQWTDPSRQAAIVTAAVAVIGPPTRAEQRWAQRWNRADQIAQDVVEQSLDEESRRPGLAGLYIARQIARALRAGDLLWVGSSSAIRDLDLAPGDLAAAMVFAHRGLAGIDGTISAATGVALAAAAAARADGSSPMVTAYLGDLTFLHDVGGLLLGTGNAEPTLRIVVANDQGGAIFHTLEPGASIHNEAFERVFGTAQSVNFAALAQGYGLQYRRVENVTDLGEMLAKPPVGREIIEVQLGRFDRRAAERALRNKVLAAVGSTQ